MIDPRPQKFSRDRLKKDSGDVALSAPPMAAAFDATRDEAALAIVACLAPRPALQCMDDQQF
jgi:hypothetical protein